MLVSVTGSVHNAKTIAWKKTGNVVVVSPLTGPKTHNPTFKGQQKKLVKNFLDYLVTDLTGATGTFGMALGLLTLTTRLVVSALFTDSTVNPTCQATK